MQITHLFRKHPEQRTISACDHLTLQRGWGIIGDASAQVGSPRQVLLVDRPALDRYHLQPGDLQENLLIDKDLSAYQSGQVLQVGTTTLLRLTFPCEPCAMLEQLQLGLAKRIKGHRGMLAMVVQGGKIVPGDSLTLTDRRFPALAESAKARFVEFVARIPPGFVVRTSDVILALGLANAYYRSIPMFLKKAEPGLPIHRIVTITGNLLTKYIPDQRDKLGREGIPVIADWVPAKHYWPADQFYDLEL